MKKKEREEKKKKQVNVFSKSSPFPLSHATMHVFRQDHLIFYWDLKVWVVYGPPMVMFLLNIETPINMSCDH